MFYRIKQFFLSITSKITYNDIKYINNYLSKDEISLFLKLRVSEQKHSILVAEGIDNTLKSKNLKDDLLIKAALLHDIGKVNSGLNILDKSILVILNRLTRGKIKKFTNLKKVNVYYNHGEIGRNILKKYENDEQLLFLVENHHNAQIIDNSELNLLKYYDNRN